MKELEDTSGSGVTEQQAELPGEHNSTSPGVEEGKLHKYEPLRSLDIHAEALSPLRNSPGRLPVTSRLFAF